MAQKHIFMIQTCERMRRIQSLLFSLLYLSWCIYLPQLLYDRRYNIAAGVIQLAAKLFAYTKSVGVELGSRLISEVCYGRSICFYTGSVE